MDLSYEAKTIKEYLNGETYPIWVEFISGHTKASSEYIKIIIKALQKKIKDYNLTFCVKLYEKKELIRENVLPDNLNDDFVIDDDEEEGSINELDFFPHDSISNSRSNSNIKSNDNNYYKKWLRSCIEEVTKYFTAPKSRVVITDYGLLNLLVYFYYDYSFRNSEATSVGENLAQECKNDVSKGRLGLKVFNRLIKDTFEYSPKSGDKPNEIEDETCKSNMNDVELVIRLIQKLSFDLQYSPITFIVEDDFRIKDKGKLATGIIADDFEYNKCLRYLRPDIKELSQSVTYLNGEQSLEEVLSLIFKQILKVVYSQRTKSVLVDKPLDDGRHTLLFRKPDKSGKITGLIDIEKKPPISIAEGTQSVVYLRKRNLERSKELDNKIRNINPRNLDYDFE